jgi:hypothetical protein
MKLAEEQMGVKIFMLVGYKDDKGELCKSQ